MTSPFFREPEWLEQTDSTNNVVKSRLARFAGGGSGSPPRRGLVIAARRQTGGRGRLGNVWHTSFGMGLMFSFLWLPPAEGGAFPADRLGTLPQAAGLAVADFLAGIGIDSRIRWPNDVLAPKGKICGILAESIQLHDGNRALVVGIGINVLVDSAAAAAAAQAVSCIERETGARHSPADLLPTVLQCLAARIASWEQGGFAAVRDDVAARLWGKGTQAAVRTHHGKTTGIIQGVSAAGELILVDNGKEIAVNSVTGLEMPG